MSHSPAPLSFAEPPLLNHSRILSMLNHTPVPPCSHAPGMPVVLNLVHVIPSEFASLSGNMLADAG